jgi:hypothetical protein
MESPPSDPTPTGSSDSSPTKVTVIHGDDTLVTANLLAATVREWRDWAADVDLKSKVSPRGWSIIEEMIYRAGPKRVLRQGQFFCRRRLKKMAAWTHQSVGNLHRELARLTDAGWVQQTRIKTKAGRRRCWHVPWAGESRRRESESRAGASPKVAPARQETRAGASFADARDSKSRAGATRAAPPAVSDRAITAAASNTSLSEKEKTKVAAAVTREHPDDLKNVLAILSFLTDHRSLYPKMSLSAAAAIITGQRYRKYRGYIPYETWLRIWTDIRTRKGCTNAIGLLTLKLDTGETCEEFVPFGHPATLLENIEERRAAVAKASAPDKPREQPVRSRAAQETYDQIGDYLHNKDQAT